MSSLKNAFKAKKAHQERHQPESRSKLGLLEKKKDYKLRANDFQQKKQALKVLRRKALNRNPDEFNFHMINSRMEDGTHVEVPKDEVVPEEQLLLMQTQDYKYISHKRDVEAKRIERLKSRLHLLDVEGKPRNKHVFFVDTVEEAKVFDVATRLGTDSALLDRTYNRLRSSQLEEMDISQMANQETVDMLAERRAKSYKELAKRLEREHQLKVAQERMELKRYLGRKTEPAATRIHPGTKDTAPVYVFKQERKRDISGLLGKDPRQAVELRDNVGEEKSLQYFPNIVLDVRQLDLAKKDRNIAAKVS